MVAFNKFFTTVFLAVSYASLAQAVPFDTDVKHATHRVREIRRGLTVETYHPPTEYATFGAGVDDGLAGMRFPDLKSKTVAVLRQRLGVDDAALEYKSGFTEESQSFGYVRQKHNGIPFANAVANVAFNADKLVAFGSSFVKPTRVAASTPSFTLEKAIAAAESALEGKYNGHPAALEYYAKPDGSAVLTHVVQVQNDETDAWYEAFVDAHTGELVSVTDFVAHASYRALPINKSFLPEGIEDITDPQAPYTTPSPNGWHNDGTATTATAGNNVIAYTGSTSTTTPQSSSSLNFLYTFNTATEPTAGTNPHAARTNAFYATNMIHDIAYLYGFTERTFNFQNNNWGRGGAGNDRVLMSVQDSSGTNNANFATPPDGQSGRCRMYLWTQNSPRRDGAFENDIVAHELTHGITNRMTGGGTGRCLQTTESGGMGEGWSDAFANWLWQKDGVVRDYRLGTYVYSSAGIRAYPYSTSATTNPLMYSNVRGNTAVHSIGTIWANMLHNVYASLISARGYSTTAFTNPSGTAGNVVFMRLFLTALTLQPCNPTFVQARDAWIQADANLFAGANRCLIWRVFASKGLGVRAASYNNDATIPSDC
ncbi:hypothetical protein ONZ45_g11542 [Pleurotus djamor]|nr:hypothetical protein ONZ45_g11542 [Pleurotus djamor]